MYICAPSPQLVMRFLRICLPHDPRGDGRKREGSYSECCSGSLRPGSLSIASYRPPQRRGYTSLYASEVQVRERGSTQSSQRTVARVHRKNMTVLYSEIEPYDHGMLDVGDG